MWGSSRNTDGGKRENKTGPVGGREGLLLLFSGKTLIAEYSHNPLLSLAENIDDY